MNLHFKRLAKVYKVQKQYYVGFEVMKYLLLSLNIPSEVF